MHPHGQPPPRGHQPHPLRPRKGPQARQHLAAPGNLLTLAETAALLRVSRQALYRWRRRGDGPPVIRLPGGAVRIARSDLEEWLRARQMTDHAGEESP